MLYIIGNGFDLHHGIRSGYRDFGAYLKAADREIFRTLERYFPDEELWSDLESALAHLDTDTLIDDAGMFMTGYGDDNWRDSANHDFQYEISRVADATSKTLRAHFARWVRQLAMPESGAILDKLLGLDPTALFLNFNYTPSLERLYGVPLQNILYIHGAATQPDEDLILGHGWHRSDADLLNHHIDPERADFRVIEGNHIIDRYFTETFKPVDEIIARNATFWASCGDVSDVYVLGHSLAPVDHPYFEQICRSKPQGFQWHVSYYGSVGDRPEQMAALNVPAPSVRYFELPELARTAGLQGRLF
jgi:hypothetical protein